MIHFRTCHEIQDRLDEPRYRIRSSLMNIELSFSVATRSALSSAFASCDALSRLRTAGFDRCGRVASGAEVLGELSG